MGGHGHGHEGLAKVPSPDIYKVEEVPELVYLEKRLAEKGLKDPWIRNEVWRYKHAIPNPYIRGLKGLTRGYKLGIPAFLLTLAVERYFGIDYGVGHHDESHDTSGHH